MHVCFRKVVFSTSPQNDIKLAYTMSLTRVPHYGVSSPIQVVKSDHAEFIHHSRTLIRQGDVRAGKQRCDILCFLVRVDSARRLTSLVRLVIVIVVYRLVVDAFGFVVGRRTDIDVVLGVTSAKITERRLPSRAWRCVRHSSHE